MYKQQFLLELLEKLYFVSNILKDIVSCDRQDIVSSPLLK